MARLAAIVERSRAPRIGRYAVFGTAVLGAMLVGIAMTQAPDTSANKPAQTDQGSRWRFPGFGNATGGQQRLDISSLEALRSTVFFDPATGEAAVWYSITADGTVELYPRSGHRLKPVTPEIVQLLERRLRTVEQQRLVESERRAATARADAEIQKARTQANARRDGPAVAVRAPAQTDSHAPPAAESRAEPGPAVAGRAQAKPESSTPPSAAESRAEPGPATPLAMAPGTGSDSERRTARAGEAPAPIDAPPAGRNREVRYNELVSTARALLDAGRPEEARTQAQRAIHVDPSRSAARSLWAEAQTMVDAADLRRYERRR